MTHHTPLALLGEGTVVEVLPVPHSCSLSLSFSLFLSLTHTYSDSNAGVSPSLVTPGDRNLTTNLTKSKVREEERVRDKFLLMELKKIQYIYLCTI